MKENRKIHALLQLIDDPDEDVYTTVSHCIVQMGRDVIPNLEHLWETTTDSYIQDRIEMLIHRVQLEDLQHEFSIWKINGCDNLLQGLLLVARFRYPDLHPEPYIRELEKIKRTIWLELNNHLTPLEKINVLIHVLFQFIQLKGSEVNYSRPDEFMIHKVLESKKGNAISNGLILLLVSQLLELNIKAIGIPRQFILAYFHPTADINNQNNIAFYLDGATGQIYSHKDVETYFNRIQLPASPHFFHPLSNRKLVSGLLKEYSKCYHLTEDAGRKAELENLSDFLMKE
jgi:regulator of sirC expression with transglutaminase-like and TPR domain